MNIQNVLLNSIVFIIPIITAIYITVGIKLFKNTTKNAINYFSLFMFASAIYSFGYFLELNCESLKILLLVRNFEYLGAVFIPTFAILFVAELTEIKIGKKIKELLVIISLILWLSFITNPIYNIIYNSIDFQIIDGFSIVKVVRGPIFYSMMIYHILFLIFSSIVLLRAYEKSIKTSSKRSFLFLFIAFQLPWFTMLFILFGFDTYIDPVPVTIMILCILMGINELRNDMFELKKNKWRNPIFNISKRKSLEIALSDNGNEVERPPQSLGAGNSTKVIQDSSAAISAEAGRINWKRLGIREFPEHKKKLEEILYLNDHDHLTGLYNRRFYEEELKRLDTTTNLPLTLIMGDVNGLKLLNDAFGHPIGDELIKKAAQGIKNGCRDNEIIARLGGDEFIILLPKTDAIEAEQIIKRIKEKISVERVEPFDISISFGYKTKENEQENIQEIFKRAEDDMYRHKLYESSNTKSKNIKIIIKMLYEKSGYERLHSKRVSLICENIAIRMNFEKSAVRQLKLAGLIHDIGKMGIDQKILNKTDGLNPLESKEMQKHPEIGYRILNTSDEFSELAKYVLEHHERWDGKGYPKGIKEENISIQARIIAVANTFDAMTHNRNYRKGLSDVEAIAEIKKHSGTKFIMYPLSRHIF